MATYLTRTPTSSGSNTTWTFSFWFKKASIGLDTVPFATGYSSPQVDESMINIGADDQLRFNIAINDATDVTVKSSRKLRDVNAWYHIVVACDTTQGTASNRIKFYINGEQETSFTNSDYPTQGQSTFFGDTNKAQLIGRQPRSSNYLFGVMSHVHFCDGTQLAPTVFGETDSTTGEWKIKPSPSFTLGTNGFTILKDGNTITDQSTNSNHWSLGGGTLTKTEDCPDNVFATLNPLSSLSTFSYGNTEAEFSSGSGYQTTTTTLGMTSGKYYCEAKVTVNGNYPGFGICETNSPHASKLDTANWLGSSGGGIGWYVGTTSGNAIYDNGTGYTAPTSFSTNDIVGMALDLDTTQNTLKYYKNGALVQTLQISTSSNGWLFGVTHNTNQTPARSKFNFGNGYFRSDAVASAGTNASGIGIFEYDVPSGYTALSTKGLNL